ncbi:ATP synthase F1 subunit gamma [Candidatus Bipolaricaulota bacterium]|nr:ATP synthase F1 subunit gamma [Candidatus Bipolaricaulota bacterium]MBS3814495.1 ATP synthase F1 subunit gamma [Candidatus Bipolaricaulota bacterium]
MAQAREVKSRIDNIKDIKQITKAMNAIAMAKVTRLKKKLNKATPYREAAESKLKLFTQSDLPRDSRGEEKLSPLLTEGDGEGVGLVVFNSDRGLAGNYTVDLNRAARDFILSREEDLRLYAGGEKGRNFFRKWDELERSWVGFYQEPEFSHAEAIGEELLEDFLGGKFRELWVVYMKFHSDLSQELKLEKILPLSRPDETEAEKESEVSSKADDTTRIEEYLFEPRKEDIVSTYCREWFLESIFWIILNTKTSEQAIRRKTMRDATDNADELIEDLTLTYNKARQQQITREIADIIGGAEALREES